ncbi:hypothetical protein ACHAXN_006663 [Cyclotella atomus]
MNRYELSTQIGDGSFGRVMKATSKETGEVVAIKQIKRKFKTWKECIDLREVQSLRMTIHPNIVKLMEVIRESDESLYFVFEYLPDGTLYDLIKNSTNEKSSKSSNDDGSKSILNHDTIVSIMKQVLSGLAYMNSRGFFHRGKSCLVADFGLARSISTQPPFTHYVSTRWYRAPEVILHSPTYGPPIDLWAVGLILWELYTLRPLFPGNSEVDQIYKIGELLGSMEYSWEEGVHLMKLLNLGLNTDGVGRVERSVVEKRIYRDVKRRDAASLICGMVRWNPEERLDVHDALGHEYFGKTASTDVGSKVGFVNRGANNTKHKVGRLWSTFKRVPAINSNTVVNPNQVCDRLSGKFAAIQSQSSIFDKGNDESSNFQIMPESEMASRLSLDTMPTQNECGSSRFKSRPSIEQPNEFCEYLNAIASSTDCADEHQGCRSGLIPRLDASDVAAAQQIDSRGGPLQPKFTPSARYRPRAMLSDSSPYIPMLRSVAQTISRSKRRGRQSINKSNRRRSSEKPRWLLSNQNMSKRAIEVQIGHSSHALEAGEDNFGSRYFQESARQAEPIMEEHQADSVWNPF